LGVTRAAEACCHHAWKELKDGNTIAWMAWSIYLVSPVRVFGKNEVAQSIV
jgi:hypothetical protein